MNAFGADRIVRALSEAKLVRHAGASAFRSINRCPAGASAYTLWTESVYPLWISNGLASKLRIGLGVE